jgi:hypothetical protein
MMHTGFLVRFLILAALVAVPPYSLAGTNREKEQNVSVADYQRVLELLLPHPRGMDGCNYRLLLRYLPTDLPELQIAICVTANQGYEVTVSKLEDHERSIWEQMADIMRLTDAREPEDVAKRIAVLHSRVDVPRVQMRALLTELGNLRISPLVDERLLLGGTEYHFWSEAPSNEIRISMTGSLHGKTTSDTALVKWMARVRTVVIEAGR